ncbi:MAG: DUF2917 domain-containing protein [Glaciimonas sp.]|nr:DUF2917 domain-containing protein [Glaciimonas sp.]
MRNLFTKDHSASLSIAAGQALSIDAHVAKFLQVTSGRVWVTVTGQSDDYWLGAGQYLNVAAGSHIVIEGDKAGGMLEVRALSPSAMHYARSGHRVQMITLGNCNIVNNRCQ